MSRKIRQASPQTVAVLTLFVTDPGRDRFGLELIRATGISSGSIHPILRRLEKKGVLTSSWEEIDERAEGRRRRHFYRIAPDGLAVANEILAEVNN